MIEIVYHERAERDDQEQQAYLADVKVKYKFNDEINENEMGDGDLTDDIYESDA